MNWGLENKVVLVTGGSSGIGKATAQAFAALGGKVFITYLGNEEAALQAAGQIQQEGGFCRPVRLDLNDPLSIQEAVKTIGDAFGRIDVLVNNAAFWGGEGPVDSMPEDAWLAAIDHNVKGTYRVTKAVVPYMKRERWGRIVHVSSTLAEDGMAGTTSYTTSKAALHGLSHSLAVELAADGIYSNVVMPGLTLTERNRASYPQEMLDHYVPTLPARRLGTPEDAANLIVYLGSAANSFVNGEAIRVTGGQ